MTKEIIFMHLPKTGGMSIREVIEKQNIHLIGHDLRDPHYIYLKDYIKNKKDTFSFTFVRNPWDRLVSSFFYLNEGGLDPADEEDRKKYLEKYKKDFTLFVKEAFKKKDILKQIHFMPQYKYITNNEGKLLPNFIGKYENLDKDMATLTKKLKLKLKKIPHINKSRHKNYKKDIELFNYKF